MVDTSHVAASSYPDEAEGVMRLTPQAQVRSRHPGPCGFSETVTAAPSTAALG